MGKRAPARVPLHLTIATLLVSLLLLTFVGLFAIALAIRTRSVEATAAALVEQSAGAVTDRVRGVLQTIEEAVNGCVEGALHGSVPVEDFRALATHLGDRVRYDSRMDSMGFLAADRRGGGGASRRPDGTVLLVWTEPSVAGEEPRFRAAVLTPEGTRTEVESPVTSVRALEQVPWFEPAQAVEGALWSERYRRLLDGTWARACARAMRREGRLVGVFAVGFGFGFVTEVLGSLRVGETGGVVALDPATGALRTAASPAAEARLGPPVRAAVEALRGGASEVAVGQTVTRAVTSEGVDWIVGLARRKFATSDSTLMAFAVPEQELVGFLGRYLLAGVGAAVALLGLAIFLALQLARRVSRPLRAIADDLRRVGEFELSEEAAPACRIEEVAVLGDATDRMKKSLRSFGRYVPTALVRGLLREDEEARLGGAVRPLTLFFSDVQGFTALSEGLAPDALVEALGDYLDVLTGAVTSGGGTVDKFMGDGVLAFWGAPLADDRATTRACAAALRVQADLARARQAWVGAGRPPFLTRIGLHSAAVLVGNIGTRERFAYTVIGDGVNLAARLEALNKHYGTWILASRETKEAAGEGFAWRRLDRTAVVGRAGGDDVYELLGVEGEVEAEVLAARDAYERALEAYLERRFDEAARGFEAAGARRPGDLAAARLAERARHFLV